MDQIRIKAEARTEQGTGAVRRLRRTGMIPGSVMKMKKGGTELIKLPAHDFMMATRGHASKQLLVTLDLDGKEVPALMREMQNDVLAGTPIHVDFSEVSLTEKVRVTVPLYLVGEPVGVKLGGGVLEQTLRSVDVECLPADIAEKTGAVWHPEESVLTLDALGQTLSENEDLQIYTSGATNILKYPELSDSESAAGLLSTFEEKDELVNLVTESLSEGESKGNEIQVYIGNEAPVQTMKDCSVVTATYDLGKGVKGTIGIVGPKRMDYENVVDNLKNLKSQLDGIFDKEKGQS